MPLYDYQCRTCSKTTEVRHGFRETYDGTCPDCGGPLARVFNPAGIVFKGSGFYITDSRKGAGSESGSAAGSSSADGKSSETASKPSDAASKPSESAVKPSESGSKKSESSAA